MLLLRLGHKVYVVKGLVLIEAATSDSQWNALKDTEKQSIDGLKCNILDIQAVQKVNPNKGRFPIEYNKTNINAK